MTIEKQFSQSAEVSLPRHGISTKQIEAIIGRHMELDIPIDRDLGRFSTTHLPKTTTDLLGVSTLKNPVCVEEYPSIASFQQSCVSIIARLWNAPSDTFFGTGTTGSSEAVMLAGLVMKRRWQQKHRGATSHPNVIIGCNAHLCVTRFANYFDVEARKIPVNEHFTFDPERLEGQLDDNTIGVFLTLGSTYTGHYDPIKEVSDILDRYHQETGNNIPIHVDAASGGFVAPFTERNETLTWDFRLPRVVSINSSGHKYGQCPLAVGWVVWREKSFIPEDLIMESSYLRGTQAGFSLSFSKSSTPIVYQYFNFLRNGLDGYRDLVQNCLDTARQLSRQLESTGYFHCVSDIHRFHSGTKSGCRDLSLCKDADMMSGLPVVVFRISDAFKGRVSSSCLAHLSEAMEGLKYSIPNYKLPSWGPDREDIDVIRIVVRDHFAPAMADEISKEISGVMQNLIDQ